MADETQDSRGLVGINSVTEKKAVESKSHGRDQDSLSPEVLQNKAIERWDGKLPLFMDDNLLKSLELVKDKRKTR